MVHGMRLSSPETVLPHSPRTDLQRTSGVGRVAIKHDGARTVLDRLYQDGSAKVRLPKNHDTSAVEACLINSAGGLTGGDRFDWEVTVGAGAQAVVTTPACEKIFRTIGGEPALIDNRIEIQSGARLDWLPQETILYNGGALRRRLEVDLAADAAFLGVEAIVFGRHAMGEAVSEGSFHDRWRIRREGRLAFAEDFRIGGPVRDLLAHPAIAKGGRAMATMVLMAEDAERHLDRVREGKGDRAGASASHGKLLARIVADDMYSLRQQVGVALEIVTDAQGLPKIWAI